MRIKALQNGLNNIFADRVTMISAGAIATYAGTDWDAIRAALVEWERKGFLKILADPEKAAYEEACVEMFCYITD